MPDTFDTFVSEISQMIADRGGVCWVCNSPSVGVGIFDNDPPGISHLCIRHLGWEITKLQMDAELGHTGNGIYL